MTASSTPKSPQKKARLAIIDARCSPSIRVHLQHYADRIVPFQTEGVTYRSVSCHPDLFIFQGINLCVLAPNTPTYIINLFDELSIPYEIGQATVGDQLRDSCYYNCIATPHYFFHRKGFTDPLIWQHYQSNHFVALPQSYTRCSMMSLPNEQFITSDQGILHCLQKNNLDCFYFDPSEIRIVDHRNGFVGGTCGYFDHQLFFLGNPLLHKDGQNLKTYLESLNINIVSLADEQLYDGGGILFFE